MKKFVAIILLVLFAAHVSGISIIHHVCGKISQYVSLNGQKKANKCCCRGTGKDRGCCKTQYFQVKLQHDQSVGKYISFNQQVQLEGAALQEFPSVPSVTYPALSPVKDEFVPQKVRWRSSDLNTFHCVYRI